MYENIELTKKRVMFKVVCSGRARSGNGIQNYFLKAIDIYNIIVSDCYTYSIEN